MRHCKHTNKLGRTSEHRNALLANLVCSLIKERRITTTLAKAKAARPVAEKMVTLGKKGTMHHRRLAAARLRQQARTHFQGSPTRKGKEIREQWRENEDVVHILFDLIAPVYAERPGGYTRIIKLHRRRGDAAEMAILEWVEEEMTPKEKKGKTEARKTEAKPAKEVAEEPAAETEEATEAAAEETAEAGAEESESEEQK